ncbi:MAG: hypothetical protein ACRD2U_13355 [Terriglobales bacterium]
MFKLLMVSLILAGSMMGQTAPKPTAAPPSSPDYSGMYTFLEEGEFVQLTIEDHGVVTGFVSSYGAPNGDHKTFVDRFFKEGKLGSTKLTFKTEVVQSTSYEFDGTIERGDGKSPQDEGYYVLKGTLIQHKVDANKQATSESQAVSFKSFPRDADEDEAK